MKLKITFAAAAAGFLLTMAATAVLGHAALESSDPPAGGTIKTPYTVTATFDEELTPDGSSIVVQDATGKVVATGTVSDTDTKTMTVALPQVADGEYEVLWTAVTADDNGVTRNHYNFTVGAPVASGSATPSAGPTPAPSAAPGSSTGSNNDLLIALVLAAAIIAAVVGFVLYRNRR